MARLARLAIVVALGATAANPPRPDVHFLACPVAQDRGPDRDLCFYAMHDGVRYGLSNPPDWGNPQLGHLVLVEGRTAEGPSWCGGVPIEGRVSVMPELAPECDEIAPASREFLDEERPDSRLSEDMLEQIAADPAKSLEIRRLPPLDPIHVSLNRVETLTFPFDSDRASGPDAMRMVELARLAAKIPGATVSVRAYRGASLLDDGRVIAERSAMARERGEKIRDILIGLGAPESAVSLETFDTVPPPDGKGDWAQRKAEILVSPPRLRGGGSMHVR